MTYLIGICGAPGSGKTRVTTELVRALGDAVAIHMDDYQRVTREPIRKIVQWMEDGADFSSLDVPLLPSMLDQLRAGLPAIDPIRMQEIPPRKYVVLETHFGRAHPPTGQNIDLLVWLDTPADITLARNLSDYLRPILRASAPSRGPDPLSWLAGYLETYLASIRGLLAMQRHRVASGADLVVDGDAPLTDIVDRLHAEVISRLP